METPDGMRQFTAYHRHMLILMAGTCLAVFAALLAFMRGSYDWSCGFALGATAQLVKFGFIDIATIKKIAIQQERAASIQLKSSFLSLLLFGLALTGVFTFGLNVWAFAAGIFLPRLILIADTYIRPNPFPTIGGEAGSREETLDA